ncbi:MULTISPECIES: peptidoglycan-binding protein [unclassified Anabaena]|uniref:peptidoglycan-binding domain-containing protein n=1 Tax=unclassified Anabaena TaxID=2619674 RepID=UPI00082F3962|nr:MULTISPECIES: peptidoglycan-binding protein [unclassified Anabaena]
MNDIVLLMTGVLATKQLAPSVLPKQPVIHLDNGVTNSTQNQSDQLMSSAKITPPEFIHQSEISPNLQLAVQHENQKNLSKNTHLVKDSYSLDEFNNFQAVRVKFSHQPFLLTAQIPEEIVIARRYQRYTRNLPYLSFGNTGTPVRVLQRLLVANGYAIRVDGFYGALTESAVKAFQVQRNLKVDGIVGPNTWYSLTRHSRQYTF